jgi:diguanylate cyclase (GGDEF)-like protein
MLFDVRTSIMLAAGLTLVIGASLRYVLRDYPPALGPAVRLWTLGTLLQPTAWVLYALRDQLPDTLTMVVSNALLSFAFAKMVQAVRVFAARPVGWQRLYAPVIAIAALEILFTFVAPSMRWRTATVSLAFSLQLFDALGALLDWGQSRRSHLLTAASFALFAAVLAARAVFEGVQPDVLPHAFAPTPMQSTAFSLATMFPTVATLGFVLMCSDRLHQELERQATLDALTGIANRRTLELQAERAIAAAHRHRRELAAILIDADHFKRINDVYGHAAGDDALQQIAATLQHALRGEDLFGRLGGEEFVAILPETGEAAACASAERLRVAIEQLQFVAQLRPTPLRISLGVATLEAGDDVTTLLRRADQALYAAKNKGRNCVVGPSDLTARKTAAALAG